MEPNAHEGLEAMQTDHDAVVIEVGRIPAPGFLDEVKAKSAYLSKALLALSDKFQMEGERGEGLLRALKLGSDIGPRVVDVARDLEPIGLLINSPRPNLLRFMPALNVSYEEIDTLISMLSQVIQQVKDEQAATSAAKS